ncbi:NADH dehydrogenase (quinone) [Chlorobaculum parvum NCIB 8327]|uniref:NADH-quinone oxidoreductase subunit D n=1 Tax=Chlorobaculum parvum (strain DSM 263 / NCIMB 8327) TaxID=517417 RepID=NUOD_CHLP8|nr:NADH-quinone oxidoreductase subunit D [Chlorobaculum parvum]B3QP55.1 RecName: Full=NADH-quinone oxidoreductase subunit D; AltName: Full=NADH dehydrogenase I subunit D; AltName: Full=NDH-1 subunit D [Chlorobaculum parvum NCIB 8327]ACF11708.1 NADH dehydrogenase (quinone) [Chlorobaculum parvum NCIB 8327]
MQELGKVESNSIRVTRQDDKRITIEKDLDTEHMVLSMGPQHPSTHGVLRLECITDGEVIVEAEPYLGYLHRCFEKHCENVDYPGIVPYTDRMDYLAGMNSELAYCLTVEKLLDIEIPRRVEFIRVITSELNRIASHLVAIGTYAIDLGAFTPFLFCFRDREHIMNLLEWISGARMLYNYIWIGGLAYDVPADFKKRVAEFVTYFRPKAVELYKLLTENEIFVKRTKGIGIMPADVAINFAWSGPMLRGSGVKWDLRRNDPYSVYPELDFEVPVPDGKFSDVGDCLSRHLVRALEMEESLKIIEQCLDKMPEEQGFDPRALIPKKIRPKAGEVYGRAENPRGELGYYIVSDGKSTKPVRCKARSSCFVNLAAMKDLSKGQLLPDLVAIIGSIDIVLGEVDR